ncbi:unnamed protein product [Lactuca virosa]|uniref:Uncharacterized protein n=1 Tax=Lactuca virosa TaxID=75947 RepID=A0AAU9NZG2_9ASTR|nr:unnamed protein product [Lactuca virosa]
MFGLSMTTAQLQSQSNTLFMLTGINLLPVVVFRVFDGGCFSGDLPISIPDYLHILSVLNLSWCSAMISMEPFHFFIMFLLLHLYNLCTKISKILSKLVYLHGEEMLKFDDLKNDNLATKTLDTTQVAMETLPLQYLAPRDMSIVLSNHCWVQAVKGNGKTKPQRGDVAVEEDMTIRQNKSPYQGRGSRGNDSCRGILVGPGLLDDEGTLFFTQNMQGMILKERHSLNLIFRIPKMPLPFFRLLIHQNDMVFFHQGGAEGSIGGRFANKIDFGKWVKVTGGRKATQ